MNELTQTQPVESRIDTTASSGQFRSTLTSSDDGYTARGAIARWRAIDHALGDVIGTRAVHALLNRSIRRNRNDYRWLSAVAESTPDAPGFESLLTALSRQSHFVASAANSALERDFRLDLAELIGAELCDLVFRHAAKCAMSRQSERHDRANRSVEQMPSGLLARVNEMLALAAIRAADKADEAARKLSELDRSSHRDPLTNTPNRALFLDRLQSAIVLAGRRRSRLALLFIDLDEFKTINDTLGHPIGDAVLKLVATRLAAAVRNSDSVTRYGGDEFLVLLSEISEPANAVLIAREIKAKLALPAKIDGHTLHLSASVGVSVYPEHGADADTLISRADSAMYRAKYARSRRGSISRSPSCDTGP